MGWCVAVSSFLPIPILMIHELIKQKFNLSKSFMPTDEWIPGDEQLVNAYREKYYYNNSNDNNKPALTISPVIRQISIVSSELVEKQTSTISTGYGLGLTFENFAFQRTLDGDEKCTNL